MAAVRVEIVLVGLAAAVVLVLAAVIITVLLVSHRGPATADPVTPSENETDHEPEAAPIADEQQVLDAGRRTLHEREQRLEKARQRVEDSLERLATEQLELGEVRAQLKTALADAEAERERIAGLTAEAARAELIAAQESEARRVAARIARDIEGAARKDADKRARHLVAQAASRVASEQTAESVVSVVKLPSEEMKGRIIGREGRNIRAFESVTGVNVIIDETPESVMLSCFDPVRREIARVALEALVLDGRIHPQRIEDAHRRSAAEVEDRCAEAARAALVEVDITDLHDGLVAVIGKLHHRTSYGQNVLRHLVESAHLAGTMAAELGLDSASIRDARRAAFLHDIGKALTHEVEGSHAIVGAQLLRRHGERDEIVHAVEAHHDEVIPRTITALLTQASDACSGGRPGARREAADAYVSRLEHIEEMARAHTGVTQAFAMQAGHEVRVLVDPADVDDLGCQVIARQLAEQVEATLSYPGQIRITVIRESRAIEVAH